MKFFIVVSALIFLSSCRSADRYMVNLCDKSDLTEWSTTSEFQMRSYKDPTVNVALTVEVDRDGAVSIYANGEDLYHGPFTKFCRINGLFIGEYDALDESLQKEVGAVSFNFGEWKTGFSRKFREIQTTRVRFEKVDATVPDAEFDKIFEQVEKKNSTSATPSFYHRFNNQNLANPKDLAKYATLTPKAENDRLNLELYILEVQK